MARMGECVHTLVHITSAAFIATCGIVARCTGSDDEPRHLA